MANKYADTSYQILCVNIFFDEDSFENRKDRENHPDSLSLDVPTRLLPLEESNFKKFKDEVEMFAYNTISKKFGGEVVSMQIWLPNKR